MVAQFAFRCRDCGHGQFEAAGIANDEPEGSGADEWHYQLRLRCARCSAVAAQVTTRLDGTTVLEQRFAQAAGRAAPPAEH